MCLNQLPHNVVLQITGHLDITSKLALAFSDKYLFETIIPTCYSIIIYRPASKATNIDVTSKTDGITLLNESNVHSFFNTISHSSFLNFSYSNFIQELYLEDITIDILDLSSWRNSIGSSLTFQSLKIYQFPNNLEIRPLTYENVPNLNALIVDFNFCNFLDLNNGSIAFLNYEKIKILFFKSNLGKNEDMVIFKLLTKFPQMIKNLNQLHFLVDDDNYNIVYRRIVGFFAILRKMNLVMFNISHLSLSLTNASSSTIISLISKHIIVENLIDLKLFIQDDSKILNLVKTLDKLSLIIDQHGFNIKNLLIKYDLINQDIDKNHLRSMMLLKFCESFSNLSNLNIDLNIDGLNFSNVLMILGSPISNNVSTLKDIRINVNKPSENLIGNILPILEDAILLFPYFHFIDSCGCQICDSILEKLCLNDYLMNETIRVTTLLMIGQELDLVQSASTYHINSCSVINKYSRFLRNKSLFSENGYLFDHLVGDQINHSLNYIKNLKYFEICGLIYTRDTMNSYSFNDDNIHSSMDVDNNPSSSDNIRFKLLNGNTFTGFDDSIVNNIFGLREVLSGTY